MSVARPRDIGLRGLHLVVLSAFALAQPLFDLLGDTPEFFVVRGSTTWDIVAFAVGLVLVPPGALLLVESLAGLAHPRAQDVLHLVFVAALAALVALQGLKRLGGVSSTVSFAVAGLAAAGFAVAYGRRTSVRSFVTILAPAPLVFFSLFLVHSPLEKLSLDTEAHARPLPTVRSTTPVVLVVFDELPITSLMDARRRIDAVRYPSFGALAADSTWFRNATTVHEHTTEAVPAILSGEDPKPGRLPLIADHPDNLFTFLGGSYRMNVFEPVTQLCPTDLCPRQRESFTNWMRSLGEDLGVVYLHVVLPDTLEQRVPSVSQTWQDFGKDHADEQLAAKPLAVRNAKDIDQAVGRQLWRDQRFQFERYVYSVTASRRPTLYVVHSMLPHAPWRFLPSGRQYADALGIDGLTKDTWGRDEWLVTQGYQRHLLQTGFVDRLLGELLARLRKTGLYDRSLVVLTADHGVSFRPGDRRRGVTPTNIQDIASVPLFVKRPHQSAPRIIDRNVRTTDIVPTIADVLDTSLPYRADGRSLFDPANDRTRVIVAQRVGPSVSAEAASVTSRKYETLSRMLSIFRSGRGDLFAIGPHAELVGKPVGALPLVHATATSASLDNEALLRSVDLRSALAPSHVTGKLGGDGARAGLDLVIAVNGRIAAVTRSFASAGAVAFSAFLPESAFRQGANEVEVLSVSGRGGLRLARLGGSGSGASYALVDTGAGEAIRSSDGGEIPVVPEALGGVVEDWFSEQDSVRFGGWAGDLTERKPADTVLAFADGRLVYSGTPSVGRADLAKRYPGLGRSGFVAEVPKNLVGDGGDTSLRFFALRGGVASELSYARDFPWKPDR